MDNLMTYDCRSTIWPDACRWCHFHWVGIAVTLLAIAATVGLVELLAYLLREKPKGPARMPPAIGSIIEVHFVSLAGGSDGWYRRQVHVLSSSGYMATALPGARDWHTSEVWIPIDGDDWRWPKGQS